MAVVRPMGDVARRVLPIIMAALGAVGSAVAPAPLSAEVVPRAASSPFVTSDNVDFLANVPTARGMSSVTFATHRPIAYVSTFEGLQIYDISNPTLPALVSAVPLVGFTNESFELAERSSGESFLLFGANAAAADATGYVNPKQRVVTVVEVTDPAAPVVVGHVETPTRTHTLICLDPPECTTAYTDGRVPETAGMKPGGTIVDLSDFRHPRVLGVFDSVVPRAHDHDRDDAGVIWRSGQEGTVALAVADPTAPQPLNSTDRYGVGEGGGDVPNPAGEGNLEELVQPHHHNAFRPHARNFVQTVDKHGELTSGPPDIRRGNVLLVTQEVIFVDSGGCPTGGKEGEFQVWYVPFLDAGRYRQVNPGLVPGGGSIRLLSTWNTELWDTGLEVRRPGACSAHYFDFRDDGFVASTWFEQGLRILDVRDPSNIRQVGYFVMPDQFTWDAYWVPAYGPDGRQSGARSDLVYIADNGRGLDIVRVDLGQARTSPTPVDLRAPILPEWLDEGRPGTVQPSPVWGWTCPVPAAAEAVSSAGPSILRRAPPSGGGPGSGPASPGRKVPR